MKDGYGCVQATVQSTLSQLPRPAVAGQPASLDPAPSQGRTGPLAGASTLRTDKAYGCPAGGLRARDVCPPCWSSWRHVGALTLPATSSWPTLALEASSAQMPNPTHPPAVAEAGESTAWCVVI